jgi:phosphohistidine swiveling domain-containing protein
MEKINFVKRWETKHPLYRLEGALRAHIEYADIPACDCRNILMSIKDGVVTTYYDVTDLERAHKNGCQIINDKKKIKKYLKYVSNNCQKLLKLAKFIHICQLSKLSNKKIAKIYNRYFEYFSILFASYNLSRPDYLQNVEKEIRREIITKEKNLEILEYIFATLTTPTKNSLLSIHEIKKLEFALLVREYLDKKKKNSKNIDEFIFHNKKLANKLSQLIDQFCWLSTQEENPPLDKKFYLTEIKKLLKLTLSELNTKITNLKNKEYFKNKERKTIIDKYKFSEDFLTLCDNVSRLAELRWKIRFWWTESGYRGSNLFAELDKRMGLKKKLDIGLYYSDYLLKDEVLNFLNEDIKVCPIEIENRLRRSILLMLNKKVNLFVGSTADEIERQFIKKYNFTNLKEIKGKIASKGIARGQAWVLSPSIKNQVAKSRKMKKGDILIAPMTRPQFMEAFGKASAIVTDEGGITCHAAVISRELGIPCIIGTNFATKIFKDGDMIEVNANNGVVRKI